MQGITLTVTEACYMLSMIAERKDYLKRRFDKIYRFMDRRGDLVTYPERLALVHNEMLEISHVERELRTFIAHSALSPQLRDLIDAPRIEKTDEEY